MRHSSSVLLPLLALALAGCGTDKSVPKSAADGAPAGSEASAGSAATTIHLVVGGGAHAGTYDAKSNDITCSYGFAGPGTWGNQYSVTGKNPNEFSSLQLIVDAKDAADGTDEFLMTVGFGELLQSGYTEHTIDTRKNASTKKGSGTITVDDRQTGGKVTFKGTAGDGATLEGTIDCHRMMRGSE